MLGCGCIASESGNAVYIIGLASSKNNVLSRWSEEEGGASCIISEVEISSRPSGSEYFSFIESLSPARLYIRAILRLHESPQGPLDLHRSFMASGLCLAYRQQEGYGATPRIFNSRKMYFSIERLYIDRLITYQDTHKMQYSFSANFKS